MSVLLLPADDTGCGRQRMLWPAAALQARGYDVICDVENSSLWATVVPDEDGVEQVIAAGVDPGIDIVVAQRPCNRLLVDALERTEARVVVELDDDLSAIPANNPAFTALHPDNPDANWSHLRRAIRRADALVVTTPTLAHRYGARTPTVVVPNYVPAAYLDLDPVRTGRTLGWPGNLATHPGDLGVTRSVIASVLARTGWDFRVVGPAGVEKLIPGADSTGWTQDYAAEVARLDVGIAPLHDSVFNQSKSWLKPLELAALGVPFVMSPRADYLRLHAEFGIGWLASNPRQWKAMLMTLMTNADVAETTAELNRSRVFAWGLTIEERANEFWDAWTL